MFWLFLGPSLLLVAIESLIGSQGTCQLVSGFGFKHPGARSRFKASPANSGVYVEKTKHCPRIAERVVG